MAEEALAICSQQRSSIRRESTGSARPTKWRGFRARGFGGDRYDGRLGGTPPEWAKLTGVFSP